MGEDMTVCFFNVEKLGKIEDPINYPFTLSHNMAQINTSKLFVGVKTDGDSSFVLKS